MRPHTTGHASLIALATLLILYLSGYAWYRHAATIIWLPVQPKKIVPIPLTAGLETWEKIFQPCVQVECWLRALHMPPPQPTIDASGRFIRTSRKSLATHCNQSTSLMRAIPHDFHDHHRDCPHHIQPYLRRALNIQALNYSA